MILISKYSENIREITEKFQAFLKSPAKEYISDYMRTGEFIDILNNECSHVSVLDALFQADVFCYALTRTLENLNDSEVQEAIEQLKVQTHEIPFSLRVSLLIRAISSLEYDDVNKLTLSRITEDLRKATGSNIIEDLSWIQRNLYKLHFVGTNAFYTLYEDILCIFCIKDISMKYYTGDKAHYFAESLPPPLGKRFSYIRSSSELLKFEVGIILSLYQYLRNPKLDKDSDDAISAADAIFEALDIICPPMCDNYVDMATQRARRYLRYSIDRKIPTPYNTWELPNSVWEYAQEASPLDPVLERLLDWFSDDTHTIEEVFEAAVAADNLLYNGGNAKGFEKQEYIDKVITDIAYYLDKEGNNENED